MAARWEMAGNPIVLAVYPESEHGFTGFPTGMGRAARARQPKWTPARLEALAPVGSKAGRPPAFPSVSM